MEHVRSNANFDAACKVMPGGVNSPVRAFRNVDRKPVFYDRAKGSHVWDVDGNEYVDFICSWGPMILGHGDEDTLAAVSSQLHRGVSFGAPCEAELRLADKIIELVPNVEQVRMVSSGTEATMTAIRLARGCTGRDKIVKFAGNYHGHSDSLLVAAGSGVATFGIPDTPGVTAATATSTMVDRYNDLESVRSLFEAVGDQIACVILEPVAGNMGVVAPVPGFLEGLRALCDEFGALLVFDEVITGFRVALGGAQEVFGVRADLCTFGKVIGGGFPVGCVAGPAHVMESLAPVGPVYQAGTLSGNPVAMEAGFAQLAKLQRLSREADLYGELDRKGTFIAEGLRAAAEEAGIDAQVNQFGSVATLFFTGTPVQDWDGARTCNQQLFARYFGGMLDEGFLIAPSQFEALFVSVAHAQDELERFVLSASRVLQEIATES